MKSAKILARGEFPPSEGHPPPHCACRPALALPQLSGFFSEEPLASLLLILAESYNQDRSLQGTVWSEFWINRVPTVMENPGKNCCHGRSWKSLGIWKFPKKSWNCLFSWLWQLSSLWLLCMLWDTIITISETMWEWESWKKQISHGKVMEFCFQVFVGTLIKKFVNLIGWLWYPSN